MAHCHLTLPLSPTPDACLASLHAPLPSLCVLCCFQKSACQNLVPGTLLLPPVLSCVLHSGNNAYCLAHFPLLPPVLSCVLPFSPSALRLACPCPSWLHSTPTFTTIAWYRTCLLPVSRAAINRFRQFAVFCHNGFRIFLNVPPGRLPGPFCRGLFLLDSMYLTVMQARPPRMAIVCNSGCQLSGAHHTCNTMPASSSHRVKLLGYRARTDRKSVV